uniref:Uncharacterized protein n=1 Tax=Glossina austeni TaxID=7395 RepID=A0A1A9UMC4_GLOAU
MKEHNNLTSLGYSNIERRTFGLLFSFVTGCTHLIRHFEISRGIRCAVLWLHLSMSYWSDKNLAFPTRVTVRLLSRVTSSRYFLAWHENVRSKRWWSRSSSSAISITTGQTSRRPELRVSNSSPHQAARHR